jgi:hypothetical protein
MHGRTMPWAIVRRVAIRSTMTHGATEHRQWTVIAARTYGPIAANRTAMRRVEIRPAAIGRVEIQAQGVGAEIRGGRAMATAAAQDRRANRACHVERRFDIGARHRLPRMHDRLTQKKR